MKVYKYKVLYIAFLCCITASCIGVMGLMGYLTDKENLYTWAKNIPMALSASVGITINGIAIIILCFLILKSNDKFL